MHVSRGVGVCEGEKSEGKGLVLSVVVKSLQFLASEIVTIVVQKVLLSFERDGAGLL